jgi:hypothetical protein
MIKTGQGGEMQIVLRVKDDGTAVIEKFGKTSEDSAKKSSKAFDDFSSGAGVSLKSVATYAGLAAAAAVAVGVAMVKSAIDTADATGKMAQKLGSTAEAISALNYVASLSNVSAQELGNSLQFMNRNLSDAAKGTGDARFAIKDLGLSAKELKDLKPEDAMLKIAEALEKIPSQADRAAIAADIFNDRTGKMLNVLKGGPDAIRATMAEAERFGKVISTDTAKAAEQFNDSVTKLKANLEGLAIKVLPAVLDKLNLLAEMFLGPDPYDELLRRRLKIADQLATLDVSAVGGADISGFKQKLETDLKEIDKKISDQAAKWRAQQAAIAAGAASAGGGGGGTNSRAAEEQKKQIEDQLKQLQERTADDAENRARQYVKDYQTLQQALNLKLIAQEQFQTQSIGLADQYEAALAEIALKDPAFQAGEKLAQALEQERAARQVALIARTDDIQASFQTDQQIEDDRYAQQLETLTLANQTIIAATQEANARKLLEDDAYFVALKQLQIKHAANTVLIEQQASRAIFDARANVVQQSIGLLQLYAGKSRTAALVMIALQKGLAVAETVMNTQVAAMRAMAQLGVYGIPVAAKIEGMGALAVSLIVAQGLVEASQVGKGDSIGTFSANPSTGLPTGSSFGGAQTPAPSAPAQQTTIINVTVQGNLVGNNEFVNETLIPELRQAINTRDITIMDVNSRQAIEIRS